MNLVMNTSPRVSPDLEGRLWETLAIRPCYFLFHHTSCIVIYDTTSIDDPNPACKTTKLYSQVPIEYALIDFIICLGRWDGRWLKIKSLYKRLNTRRSWEGEGKEEIVLLSNW